jgi:hypothetical protein
MKWEVHLYYTRLPYEENEDVSNTGASRIRCPCPKISVHVLSLTILSNFSKPPSTLTLLSPQTPFYRCHLSSSIPAPEHAAFSSLALEPAATSSPASKHIAASSLTLSVALSSTSASQLSRLCHHHPPLALNATACPAPSRRSATQGADAPLIVKMHCKSIVMFGSDILVVCDVCKNAMHIDCYVLFIHIC